MRILFAIHQPPASLHAGDHRCVLSVVQLGYFCRHYVIARLQYLPNLGSPSSSTAYLRPNFYCTNSDLQGMMGMAISSFSGLHFGFLYFHILDLRFQVTFKPLPPFCGLSLRDKVAFFPLSSYFRLEPIDRPVALVLIGLRFGGSMLRVVRWLRSTRRAETSLTYC